MGEIFHHPTDDLVPEPQVFEVGRYDDCLYGVAEVDERPRLFQTIAIKMRENVEQLIFFYHRDRVRFRELNRELACLCFQLDEANAKRRAAVDRARALEKENAELIEQISGLSTSLVQVALDRDRRGCSLAKWRVFGRFIALAVVFVAYICAKLSLLNVKAYPSTRQVQLLFKCCVSPELLAILVRTPTMVS